MAEKEYIDKKPIVRDLIAMKSEYDAITLVGIIKALQDVPAADVVEVVRCKDCENYVSVSPTCGNCFRTTCIQHPNDFCSRSVKKEGGYTMTVTKKFCDHCGKELDQMTDFTDVDIEVAHRLYTVDLCEECFEELNNLVHAFVSNKGKVDAA